jgi:hypothetical protein
MRKKAGLFSIFSPVLMTICLYVVFYSRIESRPTSAGFWFILVLGISIGIALTRLIQWLKAGQ